MPDQTLTAQKQAHPYYGGFVDFGDGEGYRRELKALREELAGLGVRGSSW